MQKVAVLFPTDCFKVGIHFVPESTPDTFFPSRYKLQLQIHGEDGGVLGSAPMCSSLKSATCSPSVTNLENEKNHFTDRLEFDPFRLYPTSLARVMNGRTWGIDRAPSSV